MSKSSVDNGAYLQYTTRFQNTGNDTSYNVMVSSIIHHNLDINSLQTVASSHNYALNIEGGIITWTFDNINLVDSGTNEALSHGYITYRVKVSPKVVVGNFISTSAKLYFDLNEPVTTNIETTEIVANTLPVKLVAFNARKVDLTNVLNWQSTEEGNLRGYEVERSSTGREYKPIGFVKAGESRYQFTDHTAAKGKNYYRLKMIDRDGAFTNSPIRLIDNSSSLIVSVYPNPAKDRLQVQVESERQSTVQLQVVSQEGKVVLTNTISVNEGNSLRIINISMLPRGTYYLVTSGGAKETSTVKFEKL
jgi:uncharacterized repeat protein (TIGR01451 family)